MILSAVKQAVELVDDGGMSPTDAIEKLAREHRWGPDLVKFASAAYNTGRQTAQLTTTKTAAQRFAQFPLANPDKVIAAMWPEKPGTAPKQAADGIAAEYAAAPAWLNTRTVTLAPRVKTASATEGHATGVEAPPVSFALRARDVAERRWKGAALVASGAAHALDQSMDALTWYFRQNELDRQPLAHAKYAAQALYGGAAEVLLDYVADRLKLPRGNSEKVAGLVAVDPQVDALVRACLEKAAQLVVATRAKQAAAATLREVGALLAPPPEPVPPLERSLLSGEKVGGLLDAGLGSVMGISGKELMDSATSDSSDAARKAWTKLDDPQHDASLRRVRAQTLMTDLLQDDVLKSYPPDQVMRAYNDISLLAPQTAMQPLAMRSLLQRHMQGNIQPFELQELNKLEQGVRKTTATPEGPGAAKNDAD